MQNDTKTAQELVPELKDWNNGAGIRIEHWITCIGNYEHLLGYAALLWPTFVEHDGCTFLEVKEENYRNWFKQEHGDRKRIEMVVNHRHILDLFPGPAQNTDLEMALYVGRLLKQTWSAKLSRDFPGKRFVVSFPDEEEYDDLLDYEITFWEDR